MIDQFGFLNGQFLIPISKKATQYGWIWMDWDILMDWDRWMDWDILMDMDDWDG